ncbi:hypothetical protein V3C41_07410 [Paenarthrobacter nicotinovorans]|uniref:Uncharacterized protein n=1 Tax=Paenarthrobacter nicotinovorans TaxID=29320 RepID=A0ABV0GQW7_PAENI|nr:MULTISPECIES: hypothetical protein [Micrococcaceae]BCW56736.1 hypothetical protein StoSoilB20_00830 [Arthrobacter sp. StoSoilB20]
MPTSTTILASALAGKQPKIGKDPHQAEWMHDEIQRITALGAKNIRINQKQVDFGSTKVLGNNRPDLQFDLGGKHHVVELDRPKTDFSDDTDRGMGHFLRILANDPSLAKDQLRILPVGDPIKKWWQ